MSSWLRVKNPVKNAGPKQLTSYHSTSPVQSIPQLYLEFLAAAIHNRKLNEQCIVWDPSMILTTSITSTPLLRIIKEKPSFDPVPLDTYKATVSSMKFSELQKNAALLLNYSARFQSMIDNTLHVLGVRHKFNLGIYLSQDIPMETYVTMVKEYQVKNLSQSHAFTIYAMADSYDIVDSFKSLGDPYWKITSLSKFEKTTDTDTFIHSMTEINIMSVSSSLILDFSKPASRLIYLLRNPKEDLEHFKEVSGTAWYLL